MHSWKIYKVEIIGLQKSSALPPYTEMFLPLYYGNFLTFYV